MTGPEPQPGGTDAREHEHELTPPAVAASLFGDELDRAAAYAALLAGDGIEHGHLGPREVPRIWTRHLVNSALVTDLLPVGARVADVGSGAGLPGIPMAIRRPDLEIVLVEPMLRRTEFLTRSVQSLELADRVQVLRGRADDTEVRRELAGLDWVVARAVAPLDRLARWCLPLLAPGGRLLALKGESAGSELDEHRATVSRLGGGEAAVTELVPPGAGADRDERTWVVSVVRQAPARRKPKGRR